MGPRRSGRGGREGSGGTLSSGMTHSEGGLPSSHSKLTSKTSIGIGMTISVEPYSEEDPEHGEH